MHILVLGLGQSLRGDDAAGLAAVRAWQEKYPQTAELVRVECCELPGLALLDLLDGMEAVILVDALQSSAPAGSLLRVGPDDLSSFTPDSRSAHGWGVAETLQLGRSLHPSLAALRLTLICIHGHDFTVGAGLSPPVRTALVDAVEMIESEVRSLQ